MLQIPKFQLGPYIELVWRRKWWIVVPLAAALISGAAHVAMSPEQYRASTLILVEAQRVPNSYVQTTVTESLQSRLRTISQQVNSRTNLEQVIDQFGLDESQDTKQGRLQAVADKIRDKLLSAIGGGTAESKEDNPEENQSLFSLVESVRKKVDISLKSGNRAFEIAFVWRDPQTAAQVANALASQFIEQNLRVREEMAIGTTRFLDSEVDRIRRELVGKENALEQFKKEHMGMLPDQLGSNLNFLSQKREELDNLEKRVAMEKQQAMMLRNQMSMNENQFAMEPEPLLFEEDLGGGEVARLEEQLENLKTRYTEKHPDVRALSRRIENLKQTNETMNATQELVQEEPAIPEFTPQDMLKPQLEQIQARIAQYEQEIEEVKTEIAKYQKRVEQTSEVELQLKNLQRDYRTVNSRYQNLLSKKLNAQMAEELEKRQKGEQFRVIDPAVAPAKPFSPDVKKVMLMALVLGAGLGGGLAYVRESLDPAFYSCEEVEKSLDTRVLVSLPIVEMSRKGKRRWFRRAVNR